MYVVAALCIGCVMVTGDPEAQVFVPVNEIFTAQRRKALTFEFAEGRVIVIKNLVAERVPLLLI